MRVSCILLFTLFAIIAVNGQLNVANPQNAPDMPNFTPNPTVIPAGSLIIPMDVNTQITVPGYSGVISVLPYGLLIRTLYANVTAAWAINTGKALNGVDFAAVTSRSTFAALSAAGTQASSTSWSGWTSTQTTSYAGGPFIIPQNYVNKALAAWQAWQQNPSQYYKTVQSSVYHGVAVHILTQDTTIDIRHNIYTHPFVGVSNLDGNAATQTAMMGCIYQSSNRSARCPIYGGSGSGALFTNGEAGCSAFTPQDHAGLDWGTHYTTFDCGYQVAELTSESCFSTFSEPHWQWDSESGPDYIAAVKKFVYSGANFIAQCASTESYETFASEATGEGTFLTLHGLMREGISSEGGTNGINYLSNNWQNTITNYPDLPVSQYVGALSSVMWGTIPDFYNYWDNNDATPAGWNPNSPAEGGYVNWKSNAFPVATNIYDSAHESESRGRSIYLAGGAKYNLNNVLGSNIFYFGGHSWVARPEPGTENNRRMFFNAIIVPANRPTSCGFSFCEAGAACPAPDVCHTCVCDPSGSGPIINPIPGCCTVNANCTSACTQCNTNSHTCQLTAGCCSTPNGINCSGQCQQCSSSTGVGTCQGSPGCCTADVNCTTTSACIHCVSHACVLTPAPTCCNTASQCTATCMTCTGNTCQRIQPLSTCCLNTTDCGTDPCVACNTATNQCYRIPGCCDNNTQCGTSPCVECTSSHNCINVVGCCTQNSQCGTCEVCSNVTNKCVASPDPNCCTPGGNTCGLCRTCSLSPTGEGSSCTTLSQCCATQTDCETCQNCTSNQCVDVPGCCLYDSDCSDCQVCENNTCVVSPSLKCCQSDQDCEVARQELLANPNSTNVPTCDLVCDFTSSGSGATGVCQNICSTPKNWTGLIVGLAAGVPLGLLALLALAAGIIAFLLWKRDALTGALLNKGTDPGLNAQTNPAFDNPVKVSSSGF